MNMVEIFDPEMLYVECEECGNPVLWEPGDTTRVLQEAGVDPRDLDERCVLLSKGCPSCRPEDTSFTTRLVRLERAADENGERDVRPG